MKARHQGIFPFRPFPTAVTDFTGLFFAPKVLQTSSIGYLPLEATHIDRPRRTLLSMQLSAVVTFSVFPLSGSRFLRQTGSTSSDLFQSNISSPAIGFVFSFAQWRVAVGGLSFVFTNARAE
jgi:hypothetical protein